jgi:hypothetical protein
MPFINVKLIEGVLRPVTWCVVSRRRQPAELGTLARREAHIGWLKVAASVPDW